VASTLAIAIAAGVPIGFAVLHRGFPVSDVDLLAKTVWVTNGVDLLAGRLNRQIEELDGSAQAASTTIDVVQNGDTIFLFDPIAGRIQRIDPAFTTLTQETTIPTNAEIGLGGSTLAILDPKTGKLWVNDVANKLSFDPSTSRPDVILGKNAHETVSPDGTVYAISPSKNKLFTIDGPGGAISERTMDVGSKAELSSVGNHPVALDLGTNSLIREDNSRVKLPQTGLKLQQAGKDNSVAIVATSTGLLRVPLSGTDVKTISAGVATPVTDPAAVSSPVWLDGCAHGAWAGAQRYLMACDGQQPQSQKIAEATEGGTLEFRVNKSVIALNNLTNGNVWVLNEHLKLVDNWPEVSPPKQSNIKKGTKKSTTQSFEDAVADRSAVNRPPVARNDTYGARPGRTTILPVLDNDTDADGDVLTVTKFTQPGKSVGHVDVIDGGRALQLTPSVDSKGSANFSYSISDGRTNGTAHADVSVRIVPQSENHPPISKRETTLNVESGGTVTYNALTDWIDPDGDDIFLVSASPSSGDVVRFTPDGFITFQHKSGQLGAKKVHFVVSDGIAEATGTLTVNVRATGSMKPVGTPDFAHTFIDQPVVISPLDNDISPSGKGLTLLGVHQVPAGTKAVTNLERGTVTFSSSTAGAYYFTYGLSSGAKTNVGLVRVDVEEDPAKPLPPIAVKDTAYLRAGQPSTVRVLDNDVSPNGRVLAVQSVDTSGADPSLSVELLNNTLVRITSSSALTRQTQFTYTISDGQSTAVAGVTVVPVPPIVNRQPPVAVPDRVNVRAGDIVSLSVLDNDYHPDQAELILNPVLPDVSNDGGGLVFVNGNTIRYQAPKTSGTYSVLYRVHDQFGESATTTATFVVVPPSLKTNRPPVLTPQVARTFSGSKVDIRVPLDGVDPDGDSVVITGVTQSPVLGYISKQDSTSFEYTAYPGQAGTDTFKYQVEDAYGAKAIGTIDIGVIPRPATSFPPNAVDDSVEARPGRTISVPVLANDSDPNGYQLHVTKKLLEVEKGITAYVDDNTVIVKAPKTQKTYSIQYQVDNAHGGTDPAFIQVKVTKHAKILPPTATDYYVPVSALVGKTSAKVDLANLIANPGGLKSDLVVSVEGPNASSATVNANQTITVRPGKTRQAIAYRVTNVPDKLHATAFLIVPPKISASYAPPPYLDPKFTNQVVPMNGTKEWKLSNIVIVPSGRPAILTGRTTTTSLNGNGSAVYIDNHTIRFEPRKNFRGTGAVTFQVTDGKSKDDPNGNVATLTFPVTIGDRNFTDTPPTFSSQTRQIESDGSSTTIDLRAATSHPNPALIQQFTYTGLHGGTRDIHGTISGGNLVVSSPLGVLPGAKATFGFTINYKSFRVPGTVTVTTVTSTRPPIGPVEDDVKGQRSQSSTLNVLTNDFNPFASKNIPLTVTEAHIENAADSAATMTFHKNGDMVITPDAVFIGIVSVEYTVEDATKDPSRARHGRALLNVRDVPSKPDAPQITGESDGAVSISWATPDTNGENIDGYQIRWNGGAAHVDGNTATYTATGLTNGTQYQFTVSAHNLLGDSQISDQSAAAVPYGKPSAPTVSAPTSSNDGNGTVSMQWSASNGNGRDVSNYVWTLYDHGTQVSNGTVGGSSLNATYAGTVGDSYSFSVHAVGPGGAGPESNTSSATVPGLGAPSASLSAPGGLGDYTVNGSWGGANAHGFSAGQVQYSWSISGGLGSGTTSGSGSTSKTGSQSTNYTLTVTASVNGVSNSASASATTPAAQPPPSYTANAPVNSCPEQRSGSSLTSHFSAAGPSCSSVHSWVKGNIQVFCSSNFNTGAWYEFTGSGYTRGEGWLVKGSTLTNVSGGVPGC
jgi:hypothetical protein